MWTNFEFLNPDFLWLLVGVPLLAIWHFFTRKKDMAILTMPSVKGFKAKASFVAKLKPFLYVLRLMAISFLLVALARPRNVSVSKKTKTNRGIDIVMAIDVSASMLARDLKPNRLEALKKVAIDFVNRRPNDRIGIVVYAGESFTQTPITSDKGIVKNTISELKWGQLEGGTAIGMGLGSAVNRLKESEAKSKVIILLTDGVNNAGFVDPKTATELAKELPLKSIRLVLVPMAWQIFLGVKTQEQGSFNLENNKLKLMKNCCNLLPKRPKENTLELPTMFL